MAKKTTAKKLPEWDLKDFYAAPNAPSVVKDFTRLEKLCGDLMFSMVMLMDYVHCISFDSMTLRIRNWSLALSEISGCWIG